MDNQIVFVRSMLDVFTAVQNESVKNIPKSSNSPKSPEKRKSPVSQTGTPSKRRKTLKGMLFDCQYLSSSTLDA